MTDEELLAEYELRYQTILSPLAEQILRTLSDEVASLPRIDRISARAKSPIRFMDKAKKVSNGVRKYERPLEQIQDLIGARIITFYLPDVEVIASVIDRYFRHIEVKDIIPESESEFGYVGKHYILMMPEEFFSEKFDQKRTPKFFELQIKTLFQHAWSEAEHDLAYKPVQPLTTLQKRQLAFTAAQAWGADQIFSTFASELLPPDEGHPHSAC